MHDLLKKEIIQGKVILFLGAGSSFHSQNGQGDDIKLGAELAKAIATYAGFTYKNESLSTVCSALEQQKPRLYEILQNELRYCSPSDALKTLAKYPWRRIYSINIDDAFDVALKDSPQNVDRCDIHSSTKDFSAPYKVVQFIKLHGSIDRLEEGIIFSSKDYARHFSRNHIWYERIPFDMRDYTFVFIGTKLDESIFLATIEDAKHRLGVSIRNGYLVVPEITDIESEAIRNNFNAIVIKWTIAEFCDWLRTNIPYLTYQDLAINSSHDMQELLKSVAIDPTLLSRKWLYSVAKIDDNFMNAIQALEPSGVERNFYRGFKPTWGDIKEEIPAITSYTREIVEKFNARDSRLMIVVGPAGSGKTTLLMQCAASLSKASDIPVYFVNKNDEIEEVINGFNSIHKTPFVLIVDKIGDWYSLLEKKILDDSMGNCYVIASEKTNFWKKINKNKKMESIATIPVEKMREGDVKEILGKVEKYGRWVRLAKMNETQRINEFMERANRQLLIALLEATSGIGFEKIIENDYKSISDESLQSLIAAVSLYTRHSAGIRSDVLFKALEYLGIDIIAIDEIMNGLSGILYKINERYYVRHSVYANHLLEKVIDKNLIKRSIVSVLKGYSGYKTPYYFSFEPSEYSIFKKLINHKFIKYLLKDEDLSILIYKELEKQLESDGQFWLQYGLMLRDYGHHYDAYDKLSASLDVHEHLFTRHALGRQELKIATLEENTEKAKRYFQIGFERLTPLLEYSSAVGFEPIVALAEGHIEYLISINAIEEAKDNAREYANKIYAKMKNSDNIILNAAWRKLTKFVTSGDWNNNSVLDQYD